MFDYQDEDALTLDSIVDADWDWAADSESRKSVDSVHEFMGKHLIEASSCTQQLIALSSGESELYAMVRGSASILQAAEFLKAADYVVVKTVYSDSSAARGKVRHIEARYL